MISVRQARVLPPSFFRFCLAADTLDLSYILPTAGRIRDFHPLERALTGRTQKILLQNKILQQDLLLPGHQELPMVIGTVSQVKVNQGLIGDSFSLRRRHEVIDGAAIDVDGDLFLQPARIRILSGVQFFDVVFISHVVT